MESKKVEVIIIENDYVVHHTTSQVYPDSNTFNVVIQALIESLTTGASKALPKYADPVKAGLVPLDKPIPRNLQEEPITEDKQQKAIEESRQIRARQLKEQEESLKTVKQVERDAYQAAAGISMKGVLNGAS